MPKIVIFYTPDTVVIRGVLVPDRDEDLDHCYAPKGEAMLVVDAFQSPGKGIFDPANHQYVIDCVTQATGVNPSDPVCAVVNERGIVEAMIKAEAREGLPGKTLVEKYHPEIDVGCVYDGRQFTVPEKQIPATIDRQGRVVGAKTIAAKVLAIDVGAVDGAIL